ncbi:hypothetical protein BN1708_020229, partial [Verticillium longisporum]
QRDQGRWRQGRGQLQLCRGWRQDHRDGHPGLWSH